MTNLEWSDRLGRRSRRPWLLLTGPGDQIRAFAGESIPGVVAVVGHDYTRDGKWSHTTYRLALADGVQAIAGVDGWETGRFTEGLATRENPCDRWVDVSNALGVSIPCAQEFLRVWRPKAAEALDAVEEALASLDEASPTGAAEVSVSFGSPTRRQREAGFWGAPVTVQSEDGAVVGTVRPEEGRYGSDWENPVVEGDVRVLHVVHSSGHGGGYVSLRLAVPAGCRAVHVTSVSGWQPT